MADCIFVFLPSSRVSATVIVVLSSSLSLEDDDDDDDDSDGEGLADSVVDDDDANAMTDDDDLDCGGENGVLVGTKAIDVELVAVTTTPDLLDIYARNARRMNIVPRGQWMGGCISAMFLHPLLRVSFVLLWAQF
mmetsp:Transcript_17597/g.24255  ORF Transcript_17597/g.24255 Transcript_17597/m.24255 type:complete len:135 (-) Transcript_17597:2-406(-)